MANWFYWSKKTLKIEASHLEMVWNENFLLKDVNTRLPQLCTGNWDKDTFFVLKLMREALKTISKVLVDQSLGKISRLNTTCGLIIKKWKEKIDSSRSHCLVVPQYIQVSFLFLAQLHSPSKIGRHYLFKNNNSNVKICVMSKCIYLQEYKISMRHKRFSDFLKFYSTQLNMNNLQNRTKQNAKSRRWKST